MITGYLTIGAFFLVSFLALIERYLGKYKLALYLLTAFSLTLIAGLREVGIDPDSENYEYSFLRSTFSSPDTSESMEISFLWLSSVLNLFTNDVHVLLLFYAFWGLTFKFIALRRLSELWFLPVAVYISSFFINHEMMQIRTAVLSGAFLLALSYQAEGRRAMALLLILVGTFFHYSGFVLLPLLFLSSEPMSLKKRLLWVSALPAAYVMFFVGINVIMSADIPLIGAKLASYQSEEETGTGVGYVNVFRPLHLFSIALMLYLLCFYDTIAAKSRHFTLLLKVFILGLCSYEVFGFLPVLAQRLNMLLTIVTIPLFTYIYYTIRPKWGGILAVILIAFVYLNYALPNISFHLLWKG